MFKQFLNSESLRSTENRSRRSVIGKNESKNYSVRWLQNQKIGLSSEDDVKRLFLSRGFELLAQRIKIHKSEVDLIFSKKDEVKLIEVKSLSDEWRIFDRISDRQVNRLRLSRVLLSNQFVNLSFESWIAFIDSKKIKATGQATVHEGWNTKSVRFVRVD